MNQAIERKIVRVDFVRQADDTLTFCVGVVESAPDPFNPGQSITRAVEPNPMTPEMAEERFGYTLADIVADINAELVAENAQQRARIAALEAEVREKDAENAALMKRCAEIEAAAPTAPA